MTGFFPSIFVLCTCSESDARQPDSSDCPKLKFVQSEVAESEPCTGNTGEACLSALSHLHHWGRWCGGSSGGEPACELQRFFSWQLLILKRWMMLGCCGGTVFIPVGFQLCEDTSDERRSSLRLHATFRRVLTSKFVLLLCLIVILPLLSASLSPSLCLPPSLCVPPPPSPSQQ